MPLKQIFLSSTFRDLTKHRAAVIEAIERLDGYHCVRMENFGARDWEAGTFCRAKVQECDLFVGIVGHLHGSCPPNSAQSYTECEFEAAIAEKKPRLIFLAPEDFPLPANLRESDEQSQKQREFRQRASTGRIRDTFTSPEDLASRVTQAIHNWEVETFRRNVSTHDVDQTLALRPLPPQPNFVHPYPLQTHFTGRCNERAMLTQWLAQGKQPAFALVAMGGMGKSALTWAWLQRDVLGLPLPGYADEPTEIADTCRLPEAARPSGVLWWSFYERDARFANFVNEALRYASAGRFDPAQLPSPHDRVQALFNLLQQQRLLLVLDGFERELVAYAGLNAAYQGDAIDAQHADHVRRCIDPLAAAFLQGIASLPLASRVLLTSRLLPYEVEGLAGCRHEELAALAPEDAVTFFYSQNIKGTRSEIAAACAPYGYHPLALRLLAGVILRDPKMPRDIKAAQRHAVLHDLKGKAQHHILQVAYEALAPKPRDLLSRLAAFRSPTAYATLVALNLFENEEQLDHALEELRERGLLFFDAEAGRYDLHPVVRQYSYDRLADKAGVHTQLRDCFSIVPAPEDDKIQTLEDLTPVIELYHHTVRAGNFDEAEQLLYDRLVPNPLYYRFGAHQLIIELMRVLFPDGEDKPPRLKEESAQAWTLNGLANSYSLSGQLRRAVPLFEMHNALHEKAGDKKNLAIGLGNLAYMAQIQIGALAVAEHNLRRKIDMNVNEFDVAVGHRELGRLLAYRWEYKEAESELSTALSIFESQSNSPSQGVVWAYRALRDLLMGDHAAALTAAQKAFEFWKKDAEEDYPVERDRVRVEWLLGAALTGLAVASPKKQDKLLAEAETHLTEALTRCRRINLVEFEPDILLAWARWHSAKGIEQSGKKQADEALAIADRCEYRLKQADIHNFLAGLALAESDQKTAQHHAAIAYERAWCDGPPHCYKPALDQAERMLKQLGAALSRIS